MGFMVVGFTVVTGFMVVGTFTVWVGAVVVCVEDPPDPDDPEFRSPESELQPAQSRQAIIRRASTRSASFFMKGMFFTGVLIDFEMIPAVYRGNTQREDTVKKGDDDLFEHRLSLLSMIV
jgi:hypothetical protein